VPRLIFSAIGWGLLALALTFALHADEVRREWTRVDGTIVNFTSGDSQAPIVDYETPGGERRTITGSVSTSPRVGKIGDQVPVYLNPADESEARLGTALELWFAPGILGFIGGVFALVGSLAGRSVESARLPGQMSERRIRALRETGDRVMARVVAIIGVGPAATTRAAAHWRLRAEWRDPSGADRAFTSQPIAVDPSPYVKVGDEIGIFIDRENPNIYAFDFSMLPFGG